MKSHPCTFTCSVFSIIALIVIIIGCGGREIMSRLYDRPIIIDGVDTGDEWENARNYFEKEKVTVGIVNKPDTVYVRLSTRDRQIQRNLLAMGLTVWFDERGGRNKTIGIHFPIGMQGGGRSMMGRNTPNNRSDTPTAGGNNQEQLKKLLDSSQMEVELIGPGKNERSTVSIIDSQQYGIQCRIGDTQGNLVYELQIPLKRTESCHYGIARNEVSAIGLGLETGKMDFEKMRQQGGERGRSGGMRPGGGIGGGVGGGAGRGGGRGGGTGGGMGPGRQRMMESLELWLKVRLASEGGQTS
jgi:uncharacterized membrane protein YgcG